MNFFACTRRFMLRVLSTASTRSLIKTQACEGSELNQDFTENFACSKFHSEEHLESRPLDKNLF